MRLDLRGGGWTASQEWQMSVRMTGGGVEGADGAAGGGDVVRG